ncbi:MAG: AmmeMemoRadiSam system radical SAM enzyme [Minisyncoccia bacterium]
MAVFFKKINKTKNIQCLACSHYCQIKNNSTGICGVRLNTDGKLTPLTYGRPVSVNIDPIEKKPLFHFLPGSEIFSFGTFGCNFRCAFCQNWDISQFPKLNKEFTKIIAETKETWPPEKIVEYCLENKLPSIAYTYNEPTVFIEYAYDTMVLAKKHGLKNVFVSNGYQSKETIKAIAPYLDAINIDLKSFDDKFYQKICGAKLEPVLENIKKFHQLKVWVEITTLIIPQENDSEKELEAIADFIAKIDIDIPWHISRFFPAYQMSNYPPTDLSTLQTAYKIGKNKKLNFVYLGNVNEEGFENTYCPNCQTLLIKRSGYEIEIQPDFQNGRCLKCGNKIHGIWK